MLGNKYKLLGTNTILEITSQEEGYWILKVFAQENPEGSEVGVRMAVQDLQDSIKVGKLESI